MPMSATGTSPTSLARQRRRASGARRGPGFTLIEVLIVVVIIGVITAGIVLSVNITGRDRELEKESDRLLALFSYAREQAALQTREYGVMFQDDGYEFLTYDMRRATWRPVVLARPKDSKDKTPQVMIFSNGDLTTFAATLEREGGLRSVTLTEDNKGDVVLQPLVEQKP